MASAAKKSPLRKRIWHRVRQGFVDNDAVTNIIAGSVASYMRWVRDTNQLVHDDGPMVDDLLANDAPLIFTCWHGQHFVIPFLTRKGEPSAMMVSRSRDAELNARIVEKAGVTVMRGSGGRSPAKSNEKGGARALIGLRNTLREGRSVAFIADIPKGVPREAGMGIITLARISGRPIVPIAYATSRRKVFERSWDQSTLNLPYGKSALVAGEPVHVAENADEKELEAARLLLQNRLNAITQTAYASVDNHNGNMTA